MGAYDPNRENESPDQACRALAIDQFGVLSRAQARRAGLTDSQIKARLANGMFERMFPRVLRYAGFPVTWEARLCGAQLWAGNDAVVSHRAAGTLLGLDGIDRRFLELTTTGRRACIPGVVLHKTAHWHAGDWRWRTPFRVTTPERTICDLAAVLGAHRLESAMESAFRLRLTTLSRIADMGRVRSGSGYEGCGVLRELIRSRDPNLAPNDSDLETVWQRVARQGGLPRYTNQFRVFDGAEYLGRIDFVWIQAKVAVETDGWQWHFGRDAWRKDRRKSNYLQTQGWVVLRFSWDELTKQQDQVIARVWDALRPRLALLP